MKKLWSFVRRADFLEGFGHDVREFALLWLVFANLDVFVQDHLTFRWLVGNFMFTGVMGLMGAYIELTHKEDR